MDPRLIQHIFCFFSFIICFSFVEFTPCEWRTGFFVIAEGSKYCDYSSNISLKISVILHGNHKSYPFQRHQGDIEALIKLLTASKNNTISYNKIHRYIHTRVRQPFNHFVGSIRQFHSKNHGLSGKYTSNKRKNCTVMGKNNMLQMKMCLRVLSFSCCRFLWIAFLGWVNSQNIISSMDIIYKNINALYRFVFFVSNCNRTLMLPENFPPSPSIRSSAPYKLSP